MLLSFLKRDYDVYQHLPDYLHATIWLSKVSSFSSPLIFTLSESCPLGLSFQLGLHRFLHAVCVSSVFSLSLFLPRCTSRSVLCLLMWNLVGDVFVGSGLKGFLSDPPQLVALPYFLSLSLSFPVVISILALPFPVWDTLQIPPFSSIDILMLILWHDFRGRPSFLCSDAAVLTPLHTLDLLWVLSVWRISYAGGRRLCTVMCTRFFMLCCETQSYGFFEFRKMPEDCNYCKICWSSVGYEYLIHRGPVLLLKKSWEKVTTHFLIKTNTKNSIVNHSCNRRSY